jgi:hypothetical protein
MISNEQIKRAIEDCARANHTISVRDISYVLLSMQFDDSLVAYKCVFGNDYDYNQDYHATYDQTSTMTYLKSYVEFTLLNDGKKKKKKSEDISFEENKEYMLNLKRQTEEAMANGEIDKKDGLKILTDISTKLNDKFSVKEEQVEQVVIVQAKYDDVCPSCGREVSRKPLSKEDAMEMYDLIEKY